MSRQIFKYFRECQQSVTLCRFLHFGLTTNFFIHIKGSYVQKGCLREGMSNWQARRPHAAPLPVQCGSPLSYWNSKLPELNNFVTDFGIKGMLKSKNVNNVSKLQPAESFSVFEFNCSARTWVWVRHACLTRSSTRDEEQDLEQPSRMTLDSPFEDNYR